MISDVPTEENGASWLRRPPVCTFYSKTKKVPQSFPVGASDNSAIVFLLDVGSAVWAREGKCPFIRESRWPSDLTGLRQAMSWPSHADVNVSPLKKSSALTYAPLTSFEVTLCIGGGPHSSHWDRKSRRPTCGPFSQKMQTTSGRT